VPYKGGGPAVQDLAAGRVDLMFDQAANALGPVRGGTVRAYAVMSKERWSALPDVPSIDESGTPGLYVSYWHAMWAPKGTPKEQIGKLSAAVMRALGDANVKKRLSGVGGHASRCVGGLSCLHGRDLRERREGEDLV